MSKTMTLEVLSSIKGAQASQAVDKLFATIKQSDKSNSSQSDFNESKVIVNVSDLREDKVIESSAKEKEIIVANFPRQIKGYLAVAKVMD